MTNVFISYRRADTTSGYASWIYDRLADEFGADGVFMDIDSLPIGVDFVEQVERAIAAADIALVLIGPGWLNVTDETGGRRLEDPEDFVRIEVATALRSSSLVIPVLVDGAQMPKRDQLPEELRALTRRQALIFQRQGRATIQQIFTVIDRVTRERDTRHAAQAEELVRRETEEQARRDAEEEARREAEEQAHRETEEQARRDAEEEARREAEEQAHRDAEEQARREAEEQARQETVLKAVDTQPGTTLRRRATSGTRARPTAATSEHDLAPVFARLRNRQPAGDRGLTEKAFERLAAESLDIEQRAVLLTSAYCDGEPGLLAAFGDRLIFAGETERDMETIALAAIGSAVLESPSCVAIRMRIDQRSGRSRVRPYRLEISDTEDCAALQDLLQIADPSHKVTGTDTPGQAPKAEPVKPAKTNASKPGMKMSLWSKLGLQK